MMSDGTRNIVEAMKAHGIHKVVVCLSGEPLQEASHTALGPASSCLPQQPFRLGGSQSSFSLECGSAGQNRVAEMPVLQGAGQLLPRGGSAPHSLGPSAADALSSLGCRA